MLNDKFDRKDIAQMLSSIFIILQVFLLPTLIPSIEKSIFLLIISLLTCIIILYLISKTDFLKHLVMSIFVVGILSFVIGFLLNKNINYILIAFSIGLPVAAMVNALKD